MITTRSPVGIVRLPLPDRSGITSADIEKEKRTHLVYLNSARRQSSELPSPQRASDDCSGVSRHGSPSSDTSADDDSEEDAPENREKERLRVLEAAGIIVQHASDHQQSQRRRPPPPKPRAISASSPSFSGGLQAGSVTAGTPSNVTGPKPTDYVPTDDAYTLWQELKMARSASLNVSATPASLPITNVSWDEQELLHAGFGSPAVVEASSADTGSFQDVPDIGKVSLQGRLKRF